MFHGRVEELIGINLSNYAIGAAENCAKRLDTLVNIDVLDAIQRFASKPLVYETPYMKNACLPNLNVLLIDARKLEGDFLQAVLWWSKVLNWSERLFDLSDLINLAYLIFLCNAIWAINKKY